MTPTGNEAKFFVFFFSIAPENFSYFLFSPRKFHIVFLQYSWKIQVLE